MENGSPFLSFEIGFLSNEDTADVLAYTQLRFYFFSYFDYRNSELMLKMGRSLYIYRLAMCADIKKSDKILK